jgi:hypothetical protein
MRIPQPENIIALWRGNLNQNGTLQDFSGNANHATITGATQVETPYSSALSYSGTSQYAIPGALLNLGTTHTVAALFKHDGDLSTNKILFNEKGATGISSQLYITDNGYLRYFVRDNASTAIYAADTVSVPTNIWTLAVGVRSGNYVYLYKNRLYISSDNDTIGDITSTHITIGCRAITNDLELDGDMSMLFIWDTDLNANEIRDLCFAMERQTGMRL